MPKRQISKSLSAYLVLAAKTGDRMAIGDLVRMHNARLVSHASRLLGDQEGAHDCAQEAWVEILRGLHGLRDAQVFLPWALRIVTRRVAREIGGRQRDRRLAATVAAETDEPVLGQSEQMADAGVVRLAINQLPPDQKAVVALFYLEEMRVAEVAVALDVPIGTVKTRLMHARKKLRTILEKGECDGQAG